MNEPFKTVKMYGPSLSDPKKIVEADVPEVDVNAYKFSGYAVGGIPVPDDEVHADGSPKVTYSETDAAEQAEVEPAPKAKPKRGKK
jgi:hypothetical protein